MAVSKMKLVNISGSLEALGAVTRGAGEKSFVAGADIAQMKELSKEEGVAFGKQGNDVMRKLETFPIPTIAAVGCSFPDKFATYSAAFAAIVRFRPGSKLTERINGAGDFENF